MTSTDGSSDITYKGDIPKALKIISVSRTGKEVDELEHKICVKMVSDFHHLVF